MKVKINKLTIQTIIGNLWSVRADAVVHVTDTDLAFPPDLLIKAGSSVGRELAEISYCPVGSAVVTTAGNLPFKKIIHAVGPRWGEGAERGKLTSVTFECLHHAEHHQLKSIVTPAISIGSLGYPVENCATTMFTQIVDTSFEDLKALRTVILCLPDAAVLAIFDHELQRQVEDIAQEFGQANV
ncbi:MAG: macro domain-containing protein [Chloroflexota bacterium]|nr:macro domain-containing protein [Chloroflexota bacterium]